MKKMNHQANWNTCGVFYFMNLLIIDLRESGKYGTADKYQKTLSSLKHFYLSLHPEEKEPLPQTALTFPQFERTFIIQYERWLQKRGCCRNTTSFYMRILRACYNKAFVLLSESKTPFSGNPFKEVYTGIDRTRKRALATSALSQLIHNTSLPPARANTDITLARDIFLFSFYTRGMSFVDIAYLRPENLDGKYLSYIRRKTHQRLIIHLEPEALHIINKYFNLDRPFLFPILKGGTEAELYKQYKHALTHYSYYLHLFEDINVSGRSSLIGENNTLTFYVARHTWATSMLSLGCSLPVISQGLGHHSLEVTQIYLAEVSQNEVDLANRKLLDEL